MRLRELLGLEWDRVDLDTREARLPETKNGSPAVVPRDRGTEVDRPGRITGVFHSWRGVTSFQHAWQRLCTRIGNSDLWLHDPRHEAASRLAEERHHAHRLDYRTPVPADAQAPHPLRTSDLIDGISRTSR